MRITKKSPMTGKHNTLDLDVTLAQLNEWESGVLAQNAMPNLSADEREFLISGCTSDDWATFHAGWEAEI
jgi:hypothetical protein